MGVKEFIPLFRMVLTIVCFGLFISGFAGTQWVTTKDMEFGLWSRCFSNITDKEAKAQNISRCSSIDPGDSPGYYEAVRTVACFAVLMHVLYFCTFNKQLSDCKKPAAIAAVASGLTGATVGVMAGLYRDDSRWSHQKHVQLGIHFHLTAAACGLDLLLCLVFLYSHRQNKQRVGARRNARASAPANARPDPRPGLPKNRATGAAQHLPQGSAPEPPPYTSRPSTAEARDSEWPVLDLPWYDSRGEFRSGVPSEPPPSYQQAVGEDSTAAVVPADSAHGVQRIAS